MLYTHSELSKDQFQRENKRQHIAAKNQSSDHACFDWYFFIKPFIFLGARVDKSFTCNEEETC